jgi:3-isopropylmalate dehydrogenase
MPRSLDRWSNCLHETAAPRETLSPTRRIGVLNGEGIGPEVIACALQVLAAVETRSRVKFDLSFGGSIGRVSERECGQTLPDQVIEFCRGIFADGGAVLNGPGGGRYVYELRRSFDLFCKLSPLKVTEELAGARRLKPEHVRGVDILMVRENASGVYQGTWNREGMNGDRVAGHTFSYSQRDVSRILRTAARLAASRRGRLTVVYKEAGVPSISELWRDCAREASAQFAVECVLLDIDHMAYRLIQHPEEFDVVAAPNLFGDVLSDLGGVLLGSRGLCFAGTFSENGAAVYSTNHGAAYDLAGTDRANPVAQILSLAMMLRETFHLPEESFLIEEAVREVWRQGWRTADLTEPGCRVIGTRQMGELIAEAVTHGAEALCSQVVGEPGTAQSVGATAVSG